MLLGYACSGEGRPSAVGSDSIRLTPCIKKILEALLSLAFLHKAVCKCPFAYSQCGAMEEPALAIIVFTLSTRYFDALDVVQVSASSKHLAQLCQNELCAANGQLLHTVMRKAMEAAEDLAPPPSLSRREGAGIATNAPEDMREMRYKAVLQLVQMSTTSPSHETNPHSTETTRLMLATPNVPLVLVKALVAFGLTVNYAEVVAAARKGGKGVGVYIRACHELGSMADIPSYISDLCFKLVRL